MARDARHGLVEVGSLSLRGECGAAPPAAEGLSVKLKLKSADSRSVRPIFNLNSQLKLAPCA